ncbi:YaaA family protein [Herbiconiux sp. L3-i23]|uniref:YaaA family protein n=1 Tax=Herbiconiux sp. L3-i23 TaxID=2905871 RepID=UPI0020493A50|nr:peroxide stress protein YaaA [Herbiconiux sp. L3-i23]BDI22017.1 hypothetical protein L3i23_07930 [Herbiconiux sp. L3-i23]
MLLLLPPSETKRDGGDGAPLDVAGLAHPRLASRRRAVVSAVKKLARTPDEMAAALKLGPTQRAEIARNAAVASSPTMPAIDRYTGVLYDGLDSLTLSHAARMRAADVVRIQSALLGPVGGLDPIPAYRLSHDSRLPGLPLKAHWATAVGAELAKQPGLILDLRSEGYAVLGPAPRREGSYYLRVLTRGDDGETRALNHFNKKAKGQFTRALLTAPEVPVDAESLIEIARAAGFELRHGAPGELALIV